MPAGLPSALLERRPDVREAEYAAKAANAGIGVTIGGFLPRIGLSAILGGVSTQLSKVTSSGRRPLVHRRAARPGRFSRAAACAASMTQAKQAWEEAKLQYQQAALSAFGDVANALVARQKLAEERERQERAVRRLHGGRRSFRPSATLRAGPAITRSSRPSCSSIPRRYALAQTKRDQFLAIVQLYKALGGGWNLSDGQWLEGRPGP